MADARTGSVKGGRRALRALSRSCFVCRQHASVSRDCKAIEPQCGSCLCNGPVMG